MEASHAFAFSRIPRLFYTFTCLLPARLLIPVIFISLQNYGGGLSPIGDGFGGADDKMLPRPPQPNGSLHIKIDEVGVAHTFIILTRFKQ